jgi:hypothetical protein
MWGAPSSGKTTFLAALSIALNRQGGTWNVAGANEASEQVLIKLTTSLANHAFPPATAGIERYRWVLNGWITRVSRGIFRDKRHDEPVKIGLDLVDASGEIYDSKQVGLPLRGELLENVARSRGIVYIFDPIEEFNKGNAFDHTFGLVAQLARRLDEESGSIDGKLPHHVAVCITKFDEIKVFETARKLDLLMAEDADPYGFPRVADDDARELFTKLCEVSGSGNGDMVANLLEQYFRPDRIRYFVTSAIGFFVDPRFRVYDPDDPQNLLPDDGAPGQVRVRGPVHPINVVEPLLWLSRQMLGVPDGAGA